MQFAKGRLAFEGGTVKARMVQERGDRATLLGPRPATRRGILLIKEYFYWLKNRISTNQGTESTRYVDFLLVKEQRHIRCFIGAQIPLGGRRMPQQKLDPLQVTAVLPAQLGAGPAEVMSAEVLDPDLLR